jgi:multidrug resistance efflux pump
MNSSDSENSTIPIPSARRMSLAITSWLPIAFFVGASAICVWLGQVQNTAVTLIGEVEVVEVTLSSLDEGVVSQIVPGQPESRIAYASVTKDQLVAVLDDRFLAQRLSEANQKLVSIANEIEQDASLKAEKPLVESLGVESEILQLMFELNRVGDNEPDQRQELLFSIEKKRADLGFEFSNDSNESAKMPSIAARMFRQRCDSIRTEFKAISMSLARLDSRTPVAGRITKTHVRAGDAVSLGQPLVTVVPIQGRHVVAYTHENTSIVPFAGMPVTVRTKTVPVKEIETIVESVGPAIESIPSRQRSVARIEEWGRPIRIKLPSAMEVAPGALVEVVVDAASR